MRRAGGLTVNVQHRGPGRTPEALVGAIIREYAGYRKREERRLDDKRIRSYIALRLSACAKELLRFRAVQGEGLNGTSDDFDLGLRRLRSAIDSVTDVPTGYTAFFDSHQPRTEEAARVASADFELIQRANELVQIVARLIEVPPHDPSFRAGCGLLCHRVTELARGVEIRDHLFSV